MRNSILASIAAVTTRSSIRSRGRCASRRSRSTIATAWPSHPGSTSSR